MLNEDYKHVIGKGRDEFGKVFYYCHMKAFPNLPVFGSIGSYKKAKSVCDQFNAAYRDRTERASTAPPERL